MPNSTASRGPAKAEAHQYRHVHQVGATRAAPTALSASPRCRRWPARRRSPARGRPATSIFTTDVSWPYSRELLAVQLTGRAPGLRTGTKRHPIRAPRAAARIIAASMPTTTSMSGGIGDQCVDGRPQASRHSAAWRDVFEHHPPAGKVEMSSIRSRTSCWSSLEGHGPSSLGAGAATGLNPVLPGQVVGADQTEPFGLDLVDLGQRPDHRR